MKDREKLTSTYNELDLEISTCGVVYRLKIFLAVYDQNYI
jgi:hypothetical protein